MEKYADKLTRAMKMRVIPRAACELHWT